MDKVTKNKLLLAAKEAQNNAYVPYSNFPLGSAILTDDGKIYSGTNIENAAFGLTICAERSAIFTAVSEGHRKIKAVLLLSDTKKPISPCGSCRQVINEFGEDVEVVMMTNDGKEIIMSGNELLPGAFNDRSMENADEL